MPRAKSTKPGRTPDPSMTDGFRRAQKDDEWGGFVQVSVDEPHREDYELWASEMGPKVYAELTDTLATGLKFSLTYDPPNMCFIASLTGRPDVLGQRAFTCCLSARGGTWEEAVAVLMYKHTALLNSDWWEVVNKPRTSRYSFG